MPIRKTLDLEPLHGYGIGATATTVLLVVGLTLLGPGTARAQPDQLQGAVQEADEATPLEIDLRRSLVCMCGAASCGKMLVAECMCTEAVRLRAEIKGLVAEGLTHDEVLRFYIDKHGSQEPLAAPLDEGFNRQEGARDGDLGDDEPVTDPPETNPGRAARLVGQNLVDVRSRGPKGGHEPREQRRKKR